MLLQSMHAMLAAAGLWAFTAAPSAAATSLTQRDLDYFAEESNACRSDSDPDVDWDYHLCRAIEEGESVNGAVISFATKIGHSERNALAIAAAIIEITRFDSECDGSADESDYDCRFEPGAPAYDRFVEANRLDASGELAFVIGKNVGSEYGPMEWRRRFLELTIQHPGRLLTFRRMLDYTRDDIWIFALAAAGEMDAEAAKLIFLRHYYNSMDESSNWDGASITLLELLLAKNSDDDEIRRLLSYALISLQMRAGMSDIAVSTYLKLPKRLRTYAPAPSDEAAQYEGDRLFENYLGFTVDLAAALIKQKRSREAQGILGESAARTGNFEKVRYSIRARAKTMNEILQPSLGADQVFDYFVHGKLPGEPEIENDELGLSGPGWLFQIEESVPAALTITADYLRKRGYEVMSRYLIDRELYYRSDRRDALIDVLLPMLSDDYAERRQYWRAKIQAAWNAHEAKRRRPSKPLADTSNPPIAGTKTFDERPLPPAFQTTENDPQFEQRFSDDPPEGVELPVSEFQLVRYAEERGERQIIYFSSALDAPGEIPAYGYWFQQTRSGKMEWDEPIYLGLQQYFPYVIVSRSKLPLFEAGGLLIEVEAKEIDPASISFPPVGLSLKREERNLYLAFHLDELKRDSDADGLADLIERRLQMNANSPDTDGDGLADARDPLPLTAFDPQAPFAKKELAYAILSAIVGYERQAIIVSPKPPGAETDLSDLFSAARPPAISDGAVFLVAEPGLFSGVRTPFRLFVFNSNEVDRINTQGAPFYPARVRAIFSRLDDSEHYVIWSAGWIGGEFIVRCKADQCETEVTSEWIT